MEEDDRPNQVCILIHTERMKIVFESRELDQYNATDRGELTPAEIVELLESATATARAYRDAGMTEVPKVSNAVPDEVEDDEA